MVTIIPWCSTRMSDAGKLVRGAASQTTSACSTPTWVPARSNRIRYSVTAISAASELASLAWEIPIGSPLPSLRLHGRPCSLQCAARSVWIAFAIPDLDVERRSQPLELRLLRRDRPTPIVTNIPPAIKRVMVRRKARLPALPAAVGTQGTTRFKRRRRSLPVSAMRRLPQ